MRYVRLMLFLFVIFALLNTHRIYYEYNTFNDSEFAAKKSKLEIIQEDIQKVSDSIYDNIINTPEVLAVYKEAHRSDDEQKSLIRQRLYNLLKDRYQTFKKYGIQQLHFHLPNNDSFLRFHKPTKFGDNLSDIRDSVKYVNEQRKPTSGFEEGRIFNGYRYVYPLFYEDAYLGSVEVSSSLLSVKEIYESHNNLHLDFILTKEIVLRKVFKDQQKNYASYYNMKHFLIQRSLKKANEQHFLKSENNHEEAIVQLLDEVKGQKTIQTHSRSKLIDGVLYTLDFIPLYNDFNAEKVGYAVVFDRSRYFDYFAITVIVSYIIALVLAALFSAVLYINKKRTDAYKEKVRILEKNSQLEHSHTLIRSVINGTDDLIFYKDASLRYIGCNDAFAHFVGKNRDEIIGKRDSDIFSQERSSMLHAIDTALLNTDESHTMEGWVNYPYGKRVYLLTKKTTFEYDDEGSVGILGLSRDMTKLQVAHEQLKEQTLIDELTQLHNRKAYNRRVEELLAQFERYGNSFSMMILDIDKFKSINDRYGHKVGDRVLIELSALVQTIIRTNDYIFRIGGEEFLVLMSQTTLSKGLVLAEKIRSTIETKLMTLPDRAVTVSIGITEVEKGDVEDSLFTRVDDRLYRAKNGGRNRIISTE
jgi:diguanylate cyclase (GGDEF)-like protein/PAS domain S-box-containing protein